MYLSKLLTSLAINLSLISKILRIQIL